MKNQKSYDNIHITVLLKIYGHSREELELYIDYRNKRLTWVEQFFLAPFIGYDLRENPCCVLKMSVMTWKQIVEHNETSKLFFGSINGFSPALRIVSCRLWVGFCWLMAVGVRSTCAFLIFIVVNVGDIGVVSALKLAFRSIEKLLLT